MALLALLVALALACCAAAAPAGTDSCVLLRMRDRNMAALERRAEEAAGLGSSNAGRYLSAAEVAELTGRTAEELRTLSDFLSALGGRLAHLGLLRDVAVACLPPGLAAAAAAGSSQTGEQRELVAATRRTLLATGSPSGSTAEALAAILPPHLAGMTATILPLESDGPAVSGANSLTLAGRRLQQEGTQGSAATAPIWRGPATIERGSPLQPPAFGIDGGAAVAAETPKWQPVRGGLQLQVPSGYRAPLPAPLGVWNGWKDPATNTSWVAPQFPCGSLLYFLG